VSAADSRAAKYDMRRRPSTYDFFTWLVYVSTAGATEVEIQCREIRSSKWLMDETIRRLENYILPGAALARLPMRVGDDAEDWGKIHAPDLAALGVAIKRLESVWAKGPAEYTVTIRETFHNVQKNSDVELWETFAGKIGARIIWDTRREPISLYERVALYAGARMNFGVTNGPMTLCTYTPYPCTIFCDPIATAKGFSGHGMKPGDQYPYALPSQRLVWARPTMAGLIKAYEEAECR